MTNRNASTTFTLIELLVVIAIIGILATFLAPSLLAARAKADKAHCSNNLHKIGVALILYADQHQFFPHMRPFNEEHDGRNVSQVYRSLLYYKYLDNTEGLICRASEVDTAVQMADDVTNDPKLFHWQEAGGRNDNRTKPCKQSDDPALVDNTELSYTYRKRKLGSATVRSDTLLAADKAIRTPGDETGTVTVTDLGGNHKDGYNVVYGDGHVQFVPVADGDTAMQRIIDRLVIVGESPLGLGE